MNGYVFAAIAGGGLIAGLASMLGYHAGYRAGWTERHDKMIVGAKSRQWASDNRVDP